MPGRRTAGVAGAVLALALGLLAAADAGAHPHGYQQDRDLRASIAEDGACEGDPIRPDQVIEGSFGTELMGGYVMVPFEVPRDTRVLRVKYCHEGSPSPSSNHTLDLGLYEPRSAERERRGAMWGPPELRGWGGSSHPDVTLSPHGYSSEQTYLADPKGHVPGYTTRGFLPGPVPAGTWAAELGVAAVISQAEGDDDGRVRWRLEIELADGPAHASIPYEPALYDDRPAQAGPGWYAGDLHVHAEHSSLGDATMREVFDFAFRPTAEGGAGLDFVTLSDYVTPSAWAEIGRHQAHHPGKLVTRSAEVITYRGHMLNHSSTRYVDHRTGPVYEWVDGAAVERRGPRPAREVFDRIVEAGGWTQVAHPTIFPSDVPAFRALCRGCPWDYTLADTGYDRVDAIEVHTGPAGLKEPEIGPNPFTVTAIDFYEQALATGARIAAVAVSDSHHAGRTPDAVTQAPIGQGTTMVRAEELSECGIARGVQAGHTYAKMYGSDGPDLEFEARVPGDERVAIMGDTVRADQAQMTVRVANAQRAGRSGELHLTVYRDGAAFRTFPVTGAGGTFAFTATDPGRYRLQLDRGTTIEAVSTPIWLEPGSGGLVARPRGRCRETLELGVFHRRSPIPVSRGHVNIGCRAEGARLLRLRSCKVLFGARVLGRSRPTLLGVGERAFADRRSGVVRVRLTRGGRALLRRRPRGFRATIEARAHDGRDRERVLRKRAGFRQAGVRPRRR